MYIYVAFSHSPGCANRAATLASVSVIFTKVFSWKAKWHLPLAHGTRDTCHCGCCRPFEVYRLWPLRQWPAHHLWCHWTVPYLGLLPKACHWASVKPLGCLVELWCQSPLTASLLELSGRPDFIPFGSFWTHLSIKQLYYVVIDDCYSPIISVELMVTVNPNKPSPKSPLQSTLWARLWCSQQIEASPGAAFWKAPFLKWGIPQKQWVFKNNGPRTWGYWLWKPPKMWKSLTKPCFLRWKMWKGVLTNLKWMMGESL